MSFTRRSAVRSPCLFGFATGFRILWKVSILQRMAYQSSFSMASSWACTGLGVQHREVERGIALLLAKTLQQIPSPILLRLA